jgi:superfamily I DNA and RNA helicase
MTWKFIPTEFCQSPSEAGERTIWEAVIRACADYGKGVGILNYTDFVREKQIRYQPDILLVSQTLGLVVIEVKSCRINNIKNIQANRWEMEHFYSKYIDPFQQGEKQLRQILKRCKTLKQKISGRVIVALPNITSTDWHNRGFDADHPTCPPLIFGDKLSPKLLLNQLQDNATVLENLHADPLEDPHWEQLKSIILGHPRSLVLEQTAPSVAITPNTGSIKHRRDIIDSLHQWRSDSDLEQISLGMQIPPGPQRIRGIAGSGKTILLCQKAARMHLAHPDWDIALVFFTRSLYDLMVPLVDQWLRYWSNGEITLAQSSPKLRVFHAWGSREQEGFYSLLKRQAKTTASLTQKPEGSLTQKLAAASKRLLEATAITPYFDAVLIDEGQDLAVGDGWKFEDKEAIYWLAWQALRPTAPETPDLRRLVWAYDEAQNLDALGIPSYGEVFGNSLGEALSGAKTGPIYPGGIPKNVVLRRCYRTPGPILVAAHALGMGLLRHAGLVSGFTTKADWEKIGYEVLKGEFLSGRTITLHRPAENSPNPVPTFWGKNPIEFEVFPNIETQLKTVGERVQRLIQQEQLKPSREILILILGASAEDEAKIPPSLLLQRQVANHLKGLKLNYYLPGASQINRYPDTNQPNPNQFWIDNAITISRMHRAKGQEAPFVFILGLEILAQQESSIQLRNQLFVALTRTQGWVHLSGLVEPETGSHYLFYDEILRVLDSGNTLKFTFQPPKRNLQDAE